MTLADILALRPADDADAATLQATIATAISARAEQSRRVDDAIKLRTEGLLDTDDKALLAAEKDQGSARLAVDRLDALLPDLRARLAAAQGRETLAGLRAEATGLTDLVDAVRRWQRNDYPLIAESIGAGLHAEAAIVTALSRFHERLDAAYQRPEVRAAGTVDIAIPVIDGVQPSLVFPNWMHGATNV